MLPTLDRVSLRAADGFPMEINEEAECPMCLAQMELEDRDGIDWLVCPNGCPTEVTAPVRKPPVLSEGGSPLARVRATGSST